MSDIAFIGAGNMASAMVRGLIKQGVAQPADIACVSANDGTGERLAKETGIACHTSFFQLLRPAIDTDTPQAIVLAIKPQQLQDLPYDATDLADKRIVISILAGTPLEKLAKKFPLAENIVRAMPNTPGQIGAGVTAYAPLRELSDAQLQVVEKILGALGQVVRVEESDIDAVTAVSGSGPAYVFEFIEALRLAALKEGLAPEVAQTLATHTVLGAARLVLESGEDPNVLRDRVTSPGGTTQAALAVLAEQSFRDMVGDAVSAAKRRSIELSRQ